MWYEQQSPGLGETFIRAVRDKMLKIAESPELYSNKESIFREVMVNSKFPFQIVYSVDIVSHIVMIHSIFHTSRKPKKKYRKL